MMPTVNEALEVGAHLRFLRENGTPIEEHGHQCILVLADRVNELQTVKNRAQLFWDQRQFNSPEVRNVIHFILTGETTTDGDLIEVGER